VTYAGVFYNNAGGVKFDNAPRNVIDHICKNSEINANFVPLCRLSKN
jgi:hypothetical protein